MRRTFSHKPLPDSALKYILESLIPYTEANIKLSFKPSLFFKDLESIERQRHWLKHKQNNQRQFKRQTLRNQFYNARVQGLIVFDEYNIPRLTSKGRELIRPYRPQKLGHGAQLMIIFDIPEAERGKRQHLRLLLKELGFKKVQQSVWTSQHDHRDYIKSEVRMLGLKDCVQVYECHKLT